LATINATQNLGSQEYDTSLLATLRKSLTALETNGH
jgi:hypothetical protein